MDCYIATDFNKEFDFHHLITFLIFPLVQNWKSRNSSALHGEFSKEYPIYQCKVVEKIQWFQTPVMTGKYWAPVIFPKQFKKLALPKQIGHIPIKLITTCFS